MQENTANEGNVFKLEDAVKKKRKKEAENSDKPPTKAELYFSVIQAMNRTPMRTLPEMRVRLAVIEPSLGSRQIIIIADDDSCQVAPLSFVVHELAHYLSTVLLGREGYMWEHRHLLECAKLWLASTSPIEAPKALRFKSERGLCFHRLPFDLTPDEDGKRTPTWDELFSRMTNARAVRAFIGSLFVEDSDRQQYCYLYGSGDDGKGSLGRILNQIFGDTCGSQAALPRLTNKHWAVPYEGKRLIIFPDFEDFESMTSNQLKSLTGGDHVYIEHKYSTGYTAPLICKLLFLSNKMPTISALRADQKRIIYGELAGFKGDVDADIEKRLWDEVGCFLWRCVTTYGEVCPRHGRIPIDEDSKEVIASWGSGYEQEFEYVFETYFAALHRNNDDDQTYRTKWADPIEVQKRLNYYWPRNRSCQLAFLNWLKTSKGIVRKRVRIGGDLFWRYAEMGCR